jgi:hypothetical protein
MSMSFSKRKWKGNRLQQMVVNWILHFYPDLKKEDVISTPEGMNGPDIILSDEAKKQFPYKAECKYHERIKALYDLFQQAEGHQGEENPYGVFKSDKKPPLAIIHLNHFIELTSYKHKYLKLTERKQNEEN